MAQKIGRKMLAQFKQLEASNNILTCSFCEKGRRDPDEELVV